MNLSFLLDLVNPDNIPDGYSALDFGVEEFIVGFILGVLLTLAIVACVNMLKNKSDDE